MDLKMSERMRLVLLLTVAMLVYANTLFNSFAYDDEGYILRNPAVRTFSVAGLFQPTRSSNVFRPVTFATLALNWKIGDVHAFGYHLANLLLHAAVTLLLYLVLQMLLEAVPRANTIALVSALLFAVHPIHTEAVASIVGRSELLAAGFLLAAWLLHMKDRQILALVCLLLALLSKESAVVFLPLVLAGDYARGKFKSLSRYGAIAGVTLSYVALLWWIQGGRFGETSIAFHDNPLASLPPGLRILNALRIAWKYVGLQVYPATLSYDYSYNAILLYANWRTLPAAAVALLFLALWIWALSTGRKEWFLAGAIYVFGFVTTANILIPTGTIMGERLAYLPSAGLCLLAALIWVLLEDRLPLVAWALLVLVLAALSVRTVIRNRDWRDNITLYSADVRAVPRSARAHQNLGDEYMRYGQLQAARAEFETALKIYPDSPGALERYGLAETLMGQNQEALASLAKALSLARKDDINYDLMAVNLAAVLMKLGQNDEALKLLNQEIAESRAGTRTWSNRAVIRYQRGELESARTDAEAALRLDPTNAQAQDVLSELNKPPGPAR